jgi:hypothetical protein
MSRVADADLRLLEDFLESYRVPVDLGAQARGLLLKRCHRQVLAALQIWSRFCVLAESGSSSVHPVPVDPSADTLSYIGEYFSDLVGVLGCLIHSLYKPANMLLRSAVESLVRGLAGITLLEAKETKSVYRLFELARDQQVFQGASVVDFSALQQIYGDLCLHVHSATPAQRAGAHHVSAHLRPDTTKMRDLVVTLERVNRAALGVLIRADKALYLTSGPKVQDLLDEILPKEVRLAALGAGP